MARKTDDPDRLDSKVECIEHVWESFGQTARVLSFENGAPFRMRLDYWSQKDGYARLGDIYEGRVVGWDPGRTGMFVDIGFEPHGFLSPGKSSPPTEGEWLTVRVKSEAQREKGPVLVRERLPASRSIRNRPTLLAASSSDEFYNGVSVRAVKHGPESRDVVSEARDLAQACEHALSDGARMTIEPTQALVAIDVDSAHVQSRGARERMSLKINLNAVREAARLLSLKGLAGIVAIDLMKLSSAENRHAVEKAFEAALSACFGRRCEVGRISRFGVLEASIARRERSVAESLRAVGNGELHALGLLEMLLLEGQANRGSRLELVASPLVVNWLRSSPMRWQEWMSERIGNRFSLLEDADCQLGEDYVRVD